MIAANESIKHAINFFDILKEIHGRQLMTCTLGSDKANPDCVTTAPGGMVLSVEVISIQE